MTSIFKQQGRAVLLAAALLLGGRAFGQVYVSGPVDVGGYIFSPATIIDPNTGSVLVESIGTWDMAGMVKSSNAAHGIIFNGGSIPISSQSATQYVYPYATEIGTSAFIFPVGDILATAGTAFHALSISAPSSLTTVTVGYIASSATPSATSLNAVTSLDPLAYWTMAASSASAATSTVTVVSRDVSGVFMPGAQVFLAGLNSSTSKWDKLGSQSSPTVGGNQNFSSAQPVQLNKYSAYTVGSNSALLPVSLISFTATARGCTAYLAWATAMELNSSYYGIEASIDGSSFGQTAKVASKNSATGANYTYSAALGSGTTYFRLKAVDNDGKFAYSATVPVTSTGNCAIGSTIEVSPNPTTGVVYLHGTTTGDMITLYNMNGKKLMSKTAIGSSQSINLTNYANAVYLLRITKADGSNSTVKVVKQ